MFSNYIIVTIFVTVNRKITYFVTISLMEFKDRLKELRKENDIPQSHLAKMLCLSKMAVSHWECGDSEPSISQLKLLAKFFDVSIDYLVGYID